MDKRPSRIIPVHPHPSEHGGGPKHKPLALVIGLGFIGRHVADALIASGVPARFLTRSGLPPDPGHLATRDLIIGDARLPEVLLPALDEVRHVLYCAGRLMPAESNVHPSTDVASALPPLIAALEALRTRPGVGLTFLSSGGTVYGNPLHLPVTEDHPTDPITSYGIMKLASEKYIRMYSSLYGVQATILRCSNIYGEWQSPFRGQGVVAAFLHRVLHDRPVVVFGDGSIVRDYLYVRDLASVVLALMDCPDRPGLVNVGSGQGTSLEELISVIQEVTGRRMRIEHRPHRDFDVKRVFLDVSRLRHLVPFDPVPLHVGIERTWRHLLASRPEVSALSGPS